VLRLLLLSLVIGCTSTQAAAPDGGPGPEPDASQPAVDTAPATTTCRKQWTKQKFGSQDDARMSVKASGGNLALGVIVGFESWSVTAVSTRKLVGDFDVTVQVDDFSYQDPYTYLWIGVGGSDGGALLGGSEEGKGWRGIGWLDPNSTTAATKAKFRIGRAGNILGISVDAGEKAVSRAVVFHAEPVELRMTLRASMGIPGASAAISEVIVTKNGGDLVTDTFDCDSVE
jgi:hypothetical protein